MTEALTAVFLLAGAILMLLAAFGLVRMPDLMCRMHATTKSGALGGGFMMAAVAVYYDDAGVTARALAIVVFIIITTPVAAHIIARAAYFVGIELWPGTLKDELKHRYDRQTHHLRSGSGPLDKN